MKYIDGLSTVHYAGDGISFLNLRFENDVKTYGTQTLILDSRASREFENDVKTYGTQTIHTPTKPIPSLRMM